MSLLARVVRTLQKDEVPFALIGAAAMAAHGVSRSTYDTDLFCVGPRALNTESWRVLQAQGIDVDVRHGDDDDPLLGVVRILQDEQSVDIVVGRSQWQRDVVARATPTRVLSLDLPIVSVEDLVLLKLYAGGTQDRWDVEQLLATCADTIVLADIDSRVAELPGRSQELWQALRPA